MAAQNGTPDADILVGTTLADILNGLAGNDILFDDAGGDDTQDGGDGDDSLRIERSFVSAEGASAVVLDGGDGNDDIAVVGFDFDRPVIAAITGGLGDDQVSVAGFVAATIDAGGGNDTVILGSAQATTVTLGSGTDTLQILVDDGALPNGSWRVTDFNSGIGGDVLQLGDWLGGALIGWDQYNPFANGFLRVIQAGADTAVQIDTDGGGDGFATFLTLSDVDAAALMAVNFAGFGPDGSPATGLTITGTADDDLLSGGFGGDTIIGNGGNDSINAGAGDDHIFIGSGSAFVTGGAQDDFIDGGDGADYLNGESGDDLVLGNGGDDILIDTGGGSDTLDGGDGDDALILVREIGDAGALMAIGGNGDDSIRFTGTNIGSVAIDGGNGNDLVQLIDATGEFTITLGAGADRLLFERNAGTDLAAREIIVTDFEAGDSGDTIAFSNFIDSALSNWDRNSNPFSTGHLRLVQDGANTRLRIDINGSDNNYVDLVVLLNTQADSLTAHNLDGWNPDGSMAPGATITGTSAGETLSGTPGADIILLLAGADQGFGGAGDDRIEGGDGDDRLNGDAGNDDLQGGDGNDTLDGGDGIDNLDGGAGNDIYHVDTQADVVIETIAGGIDTVIARAGYYLWDNLENLVVDAAAGDSFGVGNGLANTITGNTGSNLLIGGDGNDSISGGVGIDALFGESGNDTLNGDAGIDYLVGGLGDDALDGGENPDSLYGEDGDDILSGGSSFDTDILVGGTGDDQLFANSGLGDYDLIDGGAGHDNYYVDTPDDLTFEALNGGTDTIYADIAGAGYYLYANTENLVLLGETPFGVGNELDNNLTGNDIGNYLLGGAGDDVLDGGTGNDVLFGESGADQFVFAPGAGGDVIGDFEVGIDTIDLSAFGFTSFAQLRANFREVAGTTAIDLGDGDLIVINGVTNAALTSSDFLFG